MKLLFKVSIAIVVFNSYFQKSYALKGFGSDFFITAMQQKVNCDKSDNVSAFLMLGDYSSAMSSHFGSLGETSTKSLNDLFSQVNPPVFMEYDLEKTNEMYFLKINTLHNQFSKGVFACNLFLAEKTPENEYSNIRPIAGYSNTPYSVISTEPNATEYRFMLNAGDIYENTQAIAIVYDFSKNSNEKAILAQKIDIATVFYKNHSEKPNTNMSVANSTFSIYPNPSNGTILVEISSIDTQNGHNEMRIINSIGQLVYSRQIENGIDRISLSNLEKGVYTIIINNSTQRAIVD